ncbi:MAG: HAD-IB family phosphatase [Candidatus Riflebacteria bacterium]|nr:HAD-IB family phosphatase [Candidatus Riflebacteria bacterium]
MISVVIPVLNESTTISTVVNLAYRSVGVTEVIVVDDGSIDGTPELARSAGARVIMSTLLGKGASMEDGLWAARNDLVLYLDGDLSGLCEDLVERMTAPLVSGAADFVKARFSRAGGRVTMLTARPLILTFFPELSHIEQPLGGIVAGRRAVLRNLRFESDYGVDVGLLLDVAASGASIAQVDIGRIEHDSQTIEALGDMAKQVVRVILDRASRYGRLDLQQIREVEEVERRSLAEFAVLVRRVGQVQRLALFDMDGTLLRGRFIVTLAGRVNKSRELAEFLDSPALSADERTRRIAGLFAGTPKTVFEEAARSVPLSPGAAETVVALRKLGYRVGIVTDSFLVAAEIVRRRVFADFSVAHVMRFRQGIATGSVTLCQAMQHDDGCPQHNLCKVNVLRHLCDHLGMPPEQVLAVGDSDPDACMLKAAGVSVAFQPKSKSLEAAARHVIHGNLLEILAHLESGLPREDLAERRFEPR